MTGDSAPLALVCTVPLEALPLIEALGGGVDARVGGKPARRGELAGRGVIVLLAGMGKTNAAQALTALLEGHPVAGVIGFGVGGAYPGSGPETGGLALASREVYGDEGVLAPGEWLSTREMGIPLATAAGGEPVYNVFELDPRRVATAERALRDAGITPMIGPFVTVSNCSGTRARGAELAKRFGAVCETMEGAAYAHVSALYGVPFVELRGISNQVEDRDFSRWRLRSAAAAAARGVEAMVAGWG